MADAQKELYLIKQAFKYLNNYKRFRALEQQAAQDQKEKMELSKYRAIDQLELTLRGLQSEIRKGETETETEE